MTPASTRAVRFQSRAEHPSPAARRHGAAARALLGLSLSLLVACGGSDGTELPDDEESFFPLSVGMKWVYEEDNEGVQDVITKKITKKETFKGVETYVQTTTQDKNTFEKKINMQVDGTRIYRVRQQRFDEASGDIIDTSEYDPGFLRFDHALVAPGETIQESHIRREYDASGTLTKEKTVSFTWLLEATDAEVEVPAGKFENCLQIRRLDLGNDEVKRFYFARGVGKVLESLINTDDSVIDNEALKDYSLAK